MTHLWKHNWKILYLNFLLIVLIANRHVDVVKLLVHSCIINSYVKVFAISKANCECIIVRKPCQRRTGVMWRKRLDKLWPTERIKLLCHWNTWLLFNNSSNPFKTLGLNISLTLSYSLGHGLLWTMFSAPPPLCFRISHFWVSHKQPKHQNWSSDLTQKQKKKQKNKKQ